MKSASPPSPSVSLAFAAAAQAQLRAGTVEINPFAGYLFGGNFGNAQFDFTPYDLGVDDDVVYGGRIGYNFIEPARVRVRVRLTSRRNSTRIRTTSSFPGRPWAI